MFRNELYRRASCRPPDVRPRCRMSRDTNKAKRLRILGLAILIIVAVAFAIDIAIKSSSRASPANSVSLGQSFLGLYRGDLGFWVTGDYVSTPVADWSLTDAAQTVLVETRTWYLIPHFVRTFIARNDSQVYLFSEYFAPAPGQQIFGTISLRPGSGIAWWFGILG